MREASGFRHLFGREREPPRRRGRQEDLFGRERSRQGAENAKKISLAENEPPRRRGRQEDLFGAREGVRLANQGALVETTTSRRTRVAPRAVPVRSGTCRTRGRA